MTNIRRALAATAAALVIGSSGAVRAAEVSFILNWVAGGDHAPGLLGAGPGLVR